MRPRRPGVPAATQVARGHRQPARRSQGGRDLRARRRVEPRAPRREDRWVGGAAGDPRRRPRGHAARRPAARFGATCFRTGGLDGARGARRPAVRARLFARGGGERAPGRDRLAERPVGSRAHPVHVGIDWNAQGGGDHARECDVLHRVGRTPFWAGSAGSDVGARPAALRPFHLRRVRQLCRGGGAPPRAAPAEPAATQARRVHPHGRAHTVVLGAVGAAPHGQVGRRASERFPGFEAAAVVR